MRGNLIETLMGALVLVVAGGFLFFAYTTTDVAAGGGYVLQARFSSAGGLTIGSDVRVSGIKVGTVVDQELDPEYYDAVVRFTVDPDVELPADTSASISSEGILGGSYLSLDPGFEEELLGPGDEISPEYTQGSVDLMDLISRFVFTPEDENDD